MNNASLFSRTRPCIAPITNTYFMKKCYHRDVPSSVRFLSSGHHAQSPRNTTPQNPYFSSPSSLLSTKLDRKSFSTDHEINSSPFPSLSRIFNPTEDHAQLRSVLRTFVQREVEPQAIRMNRNEMFHRTLFTKLAKEIGVLGITIPSSYGGCDFVVGPSQDNEDREQHLHPLFPATASAIVHEELSYSDPAFCLSYLAHSILLVNNLYVNSTCEQQRKMFLPTLCDGSQIGGMCMSEPDAGTDVLGRMKTNAIYEATNNEWILNGTKMWITNGYMLVEGGAEEQTLLMSSSTSSLPRTSTVTTGDLFLVYAKTGPKKTDVTQFLVERGMTGFHVGQLIRDKLGMRASNTAELVFNHVRLPASTHIVGQVNQATICMMRNLEIERIALAAMAIGIARRCLDEMIQYSQQRYTFGKAIIDYGQIQKNIAESYAEYMAAKCYVYSVANSLHDLSACGNSLDADGVKLYAAQMAKNCADRAIQCLGGYGYVGEYVVERMWRDAKLLEIGGGTNESHHKNMIRDFKKRTTNRLD